ncbi:hypothetical protein ENSA5_31180 [Enhygromyxa salina]|uniref:N-acetyltransferase domain-containing protein n=1 Tax=Enhygromyxa salina TaxID=215803 RepID=A0A2S9XYF1_9BACT|nr:GNAT family N-acyltransferase [Enhygromyxa salina]PRP97885.1 hypothetical protein ENSA5_31180 [Enhygromyxa salina]
MSVHVKIARSATDIDQLFRLRHKVYVDEGGYMEPRPHGRLYDHFDALPGTILMLAEVDGRAVGTVRFGRDLGAGTHANEYFDFAPYLPADAQVGSGSMLAVEREWQGMPRLTTSLLGMCIYQAVHSGLTHLLGTVNPEVLDGFLELGFQPLAGVLTHEPTNIPFVPVILKLDKLAGRLGAFVDRHTAWSVLPGCERVFLCPGERVPEPRQAEAHIVVRGEVEVFGDRGSLTVFGPGDLVHLGAWPAVTRATAIATSKVDLLVVPMHSDAPGLGAVAPARPRSLYAVGGGSMAAS